MNAALRSGMLLAALLCLPAVAGAQVACLPPEEPYPYEPSNLEDELQQMVNEQCETFED